MMIRTILAVTTSAVMLTACAQNGQYNDPYTGRSSISKQSVGTVAGAVGGGIIGHNIGKGSGAVAATIAGTLLGGLIGSEIGASLDRADMQYYGQTSQGALENNRVGQTSTWRNPDSGNYGTVTPTRTYNESGTVCREFTQTINVGGRSEKAFGTACRQPDGSWQIVN